MYTISYIEKMKTTKSNIYEELKVKEDIQPFGETLTIEQTIAVPANHRIFLELPRSVPSGVMAQIKINIPAVSPNNTNASDFQPHFNIEEIRQLLQKEIIEKGTLAAIEASSDGWEAHIRERYAES